LIQAARIAASQLAIQASRKLSTLTPSARRRPVNMTIVCSTVPSSSTPTPPTSTATPSSTQRMAMPTRASTIMRLTSPIGPPLARTPGSSQKTMVRTTKLVTPVRASDLIQGTVGRHSLSNFTASISRRRTLPDAPLVTRQDSHRT
jgi:hypothetical protein